MIPNLHCCRQLAALDDNVVRSVGDSCEAHGDWSEIGIPDPESIHGVHVPQEFGTFILMVRPLSCMNPAVHSVQGAVNPCVIEQLLLGILQAVLDVGTNAYKSADCLQSYAVALLRRDLCRWLSTAPHVRRFPVPFGHTANMRTTLFSKRMVCSGFAEAWRDGARLGKKNGLKHINPAARANEDEVDAS